MHKMSFKIRNYRLCWFSDCKGAPEKREIINKWGRKTLKKILAEPSLENFMVACKEFALGTGFATRRVQKLMELSEKAGAIGVAQNMLGEAVHEAFKKLLPKEKILIANIDFQGARLIG